MTPSLRFPLRAGGTEPVRGSPREAGGTCRRGAIVNSDRAVGITRDDDLKRDPDLIQKMAEQGVQVVSVQQFLKQLGSP